MIQGEALSERDAVVPWLLDEPYKSEDTTATFANFILGNPSSKFIKLYLPFMGGSVFPS
jgi:hypothetical protein